MMMNHLAGPWIGNVLIIALFGMGTIVCFAVAIRMLLRPGEENKNHPKYRILRDDR